ncbi:carbohydrate kinase [Chelativorans sp. AA-79]|uniref:FGGY-family carbohydrate kinase n=1 Tax=Chelativorans sp. AA-79 TaxID=3028735 RepID=UPI0023F6C712|nr:carbohydrate kinase [Chelativorans sp. AA-79]WEX08373.1 carbohydrate kinase [Chelativorans sp. AA-79]
MTGPLAVFDLGKTNSKLFVFSPEGEILAEERTVPQWRDHGGIRVLDDTQLHAWMQAALAKAVEEHGVEGVMFSGHGCTFALVADGALTHPILDYEQEPPEHIAQEIDALVPPFSETYSPRLPLGFNFGRHILWLEKAAPRAVSDAEHILGYPQFWSWRFSGVPVSEISYLGCHSHLWAPLREKFSSLVDQRGWQEKMPPFARSGAVLGTTEVALPSGNKHTVDIHNGVHDSNAALHCYRAAGHRSFTLVSSGTWVIIFNTDSPLETLDERRDMLANVSVDGVPTPTIRFMGGREFDTIRAGAAPKVSLGDLQAVIDNRVFALPSFAPGGPVPETTGEIVGRTGSDAERAAAALLYVVLMTDLCLDLIGSENTVIVDGGLVKTGFYVEMLAQLRPGQRLLSSDNPEGSAVGAAILAFEAKNVGLNPVHCAEASATALRGFEEYRKRWREMVEQRRAGQAMPAKKAAGAAP